MSDEIAADQVTRLVEAFRASRREFQRRLDRIPFERWMLTPSGGGWCTRDLVAHVAAWLDEANDRIPRLMLGVSGVQYDVDAFNAVSVERAGDWSPQQTLGAFRRAADRYETIVGESDPDDLVDSEDVLAWLRSMAGVLMNEHLGDLDRLAAVTSDVTRG
ncbi:MAG: DinB family protein [Dehalococcoidia bacterium]